MSTPTPATMSVHFSVESVKKSLKFYRDKLGFSVSDCWPDDKKPMHVSLHLGGQSVMLGQAMSPKEAKKVIGAHDKKAGEFWAEHARRFQRSAHGVGVSVFLCIEDVDAYCALLKKRRVKPDLAPKTQFYGLREMVVTDPDGYTLIFYTQVAAEHAATVNEEFEAPSMTASESPSGGEPTESAAPSKSGKKDKKRAKATHPREENAEIDIELT